jgi:phosphatidylethanolamine/phosphatidyl-N-methylethanolamine N-methyltransferase
MRAAHSESGRSYWDRHASNYDRFMLVLGRPFLRVIPLVEEEVRGAGRLLEVAAGTGLLTVALARAAQSVVATDYSAAMLDVLRARTKREGVRNVECVGRDLYDLKLDRGSFDVVVCSNVLHLVPDLERAIAAMKEVVRPGGKLVAPTFVHDEMLVSRAMSRLLVMTGFPGRRRFTAASLRAAFEKAGVDVYRSETVSGVLPVCFVAGSPR